MPRAEAKGKGLPALNLQQTRPRKKDGYKGQCTGAERAGKWRHLARQEERDGARPGEAAQTEHRMEPGHERSPGRLLDFDGMDVHGHIDGAQRGAEDQERRGEQEWIEDE